MRAYPVGVGFCIAATAAVVVAPAAGALPRCINTTPTTTQCERGTHVQINTAPNVVVDNGPFFGQPWLFSPGMGVDGIGGWALP